jgi:hypothetical protein
LLLVALVVAVGMALIMKEQKKAWRVRHPGTVQPLR